MKNVRIVFLGIMLLFLVAPPAFAVENNMSKLIRAGGGQNECIP